MAKKQLPSLEELRGKKGLSAPSKITSIPFRSDALNLFTGGVKKNHVTEISGMPSMYKSTLLAEVAGEVLAGEGVVVIHDKERKLTEPRFISLGINNANRSNSRFWYFTDDLPEYVLTIEQMYVDIHDIVGAVRRDDLQKLKEKFTAGKATKAQVEAYWNLTGYKTKPKTGKGEKNEKGQKAIAKKLVSPSQLDDADKTTVLWIVDSVTSIPCADEAYDKATGLPNKSPGMAKCARVWSEQFRISAFMDSEVAVLHIAQIRTAGIGSPRGTYKKSAVPAANEFYATNRLKIFPRSGGALYRNPDDEGTILIGQTTPKESRLFKIGQIITVAIDKNIEGVNTEVPIYMLASTGTDVINSMWEFLSLRGFLKGGHGGYWSLSEKLWPEKSAEKITRASFTQFYLEHGQELYQRLKVWKEKITHGHTRQGAGAR